MEDFRSVIPACGFESRLWRYTGMCANRAGSLSRKQVTRKGLGVRIPPSSLLSRSGRIGKCTCLLSRGRLVRHPGSGPGSGALECKTSGVLCGHMSTKYPRGLGRSFLFCVHLPVLESYHIPEERCQGDGSSDTFLETRGSHEAGPRHGMAVLMTSSSRQKVVRRTVPLTPHVFFSSFVSKA